MDPDPLHAARIGVEDLELHGARAGNDLAPHGHPPRDRHQPPAERVDVGIHVLAPHVDADRRRDVVEVRTRIGGEDARPLWRDRLAFVLVMLVFDVAQHDLDKVLHRDEAIGTSILVDDERELGPRRLHLGEKIDRRHGGRHEQHATHQ
jgi:hypothetical protein